MMGQKCLVTLKMHQQLYKEHLTLQKSFSTLYQYMLEGKNTKNWIQEKNQLENLVHHYKSKAHQLQRKLEETNERFELLEFCFLENETKVYSAKNEEKAVNTDIKTWVKNIPFVNNTYSYPLNNAENGPCLNEKFVHIEMESGNYQSQLKETQEKLSHLTEQLESVLKCNCKLGVGMDYVIATVNELQSLMEWTTEKKETDSAIIFQKLQQLERIQKDLEKTATESEQIRLHHQNNLSTLDENVTSELNELSVCSKNVHENQLQLLDNCLKDVSQNVLQKDDDFLLIDLNTPTDIESNTPPIKRSKSNDDSLGPNISEDEGLGEESRRGDSTGPSSFIELPDVISTKLPPPLSDQLVVIDDFPKPKNAKDPKTALDICLCAIGNLRESLKSKENELLKLSAIQNDQKQIGELQDVIVSLHDENMNLKTELENIKKENSCYKEQILELEEAENDARLQAQKLGEKLVFLQEKDTHFQAKLCETKQGLEKCLEQLGVKKIEEQELRSQLKYMETLVQKYEEQIRTMEIVELALRKKLIEEEDEIKELEKLTKVKKIEKGTQVYELLSSNKRNNDDCDINDKLYSETSVQVPDENIFKFLYKECSVQTDSDVLLSQNLDLPPNEMSIESTVKPLGESTQDANPSTISEIPCPIQKELLKRLHQLVEEDAHLQQQLHYVDQINLTLWKKLHSLEFHIGECKKKNISEDGDSCIESECEFSSRPMSREQIREDSTPRISKNIISTLDKSEQEIKERLIQLEEINSAFEKELEIRERLYIDKEKRYGEWIQTEQRFINDLKRLADEKDSLKLQVEKLKQEKDELTSRVQKLQTEMEEANEKHNSEMKRIRDEQDQTIEQLQQKVDQLLAKEKAHLKQITNLKLERNKSDKSESDKLKSSYVELQLELSRTRDEVRKKEEEFRIRLDEARSKHVLEEARLISELEMLRNKKCNCDEMINSFQLRQNELMSIVKQKEEALELARLEYKKNVQATEEEHRAVEAELKKQLRQMEEGTSIATKALTEERVRLERELQENIDDLRGKEEGYKARIAELEFNVTHLHDELHRITGDIDSGFGSDLNSVNSFRREKLLNQLKELRIRETELREKLDEMEQKEAAYRETLEHADRIVASVEQGYKNKIEELEISERNLKQRVLHLEEVESRLRGALSKERRSSDGRKPDDLVCELLEAEARENAFKEKIESLEQIQRHAMAKVKDLEKLREKLEAQLNDKEELVSNYEKAQIELDTSRKSLAKLRKSENDLKTSLQQTENVLTTTEAQMKNKIRTIEEEKNVLEETIRELRTQVRELKLKLEKISDEREEKRISMSISKEAIPHGYISQTQTDEDEPDYVDIDEFPMQSQQGYAKNRPSSCVYNRSPITKSSSTSYEKSKAPKGVNQSFTRNVPDSYDDARQNLEDCMIAAMTAMKNDMKKKVPSEKTEENHYDEILPRPTNFRIVQQVGSDTLLVGWNYVNPSILAGFEVYLNGQLLESVYAPDRSKALINGLNMKQPIHLSICAVSKYGQMSEPTVMEILPSREKSYQDEGDDEDEDTYEKHRPYSMEW